MLTVLPELLRSFDVKEYRMLIYAIVLILVMLITNNPTIWGWVSRFQRKKAEEKGGAEQ